jgi:hypothetical protein
MLTGFAEIYGVGLARRMFMLIAVKFYPHRTDYTKFGLKNASV